MQPDREIPSTRTARAPAPSYVWNYQAVHEWRTAVWEIGRDMLGEATKAAFLAQPPRFVVSDDLTWLDLAVKRGTGVSLDSKAEMAVRLKRHFTHLRASHATSAFDVTSFYTLGLLPLDAEAAKIRARNIFLSGDFPELTESDLNRAILEVGQDLREGRVWFEANEQALVEECGHYLLYGGEYLIGIAASLRGQRDYRQALKGRGTPTLFVCDVPIADIHPATFLEFVGGALAILFQDLLDGMESRWIPSGEGAGFSIKRPLPPDAIVGHYHPADVSDPLISTL